MEWSLERSGLVTFSNGMETAGVDRIECDFEVFKGSGAERIEDHTIGLEGKGSVNLFLSGEEIMGLDRIGQDWNRDNRSGSDRIGKANSLSSGNDRMGSEANGLDRSAERNGFDWIVPIL